MEFERYAVGYILKLEFGAKFPIVYMTLYGCINRLPRSNKKMYYDVVFADRFRSQSTMFEVCTLILLSRLLDTHITY